MIAKGVGPFAQSFIKLHLYSVVLLANLYLASLPSKGPYINDVGRVRGEGFS